VPSPPPIHIAGSPFQPAFFPKAIRGWTMMRAPDGSDGVPQCAGTAITFHGCHGPPISCHEARGRRPRPPFTSTDRPSIFAPNRSKQFLCGLEPVRREKPRAAHGWGMAKDMRAQVAPLALAAVSQRPAPKRPPPSELEDASPRHRGRFAEGRF